MKKRSLNISEEWNPFDIDFLIKEIKFFNAKPYKSGPMEIKIIKVIGRCDDYFNKNFRSGEFETPVLFINGELWMSITPMEIQSQFVPILRARRFVATAGLGLGYFVARVMRKPNVQQVDVYEQNEHVIEYFKKKFRKRKGFEKIKFIHGDVRELMKGKRYDFVYMDVYQEMLEDGLPHIQDMNIFCKENEIEEYHFWGQELLLMVADHQGLKPNITVPERHLFSLFYRSEFYRLVYIPDLDEEQVYEAMWSMARID